VCVE